MYCIEEEPFETLDVIEVAMNNDNNEFINMTTNLEHKGNMILQKINQHESTKKNVKENQW